MLRHVTSYCFLVSCNISYCDYDPLSSLILSTEESQELKTLFTIACNGFVMVFNGFRYFGRIRVPIWINWVKRSGWGDWFSNNVKDNWNSLKNLCKAKEYEETTSTAWCFKNTGNIENHSKYYENHADQSNLPKAKKHHWTNWKPLKNLWGTSGTRPSSLITIKHTRSCGNNLENHRNAIAEPLWNNWIPSWAVWSSRNPAKSQKA